MAQIPGERPSRHGPPRFFTVEGQEDEAPDWSGTVPGEYDHELVTAAAEELRQRTMSLEPNPGLPAKRIVIAIVTVTILVAISILVYRDGVRAWLGLLR